MEQHLATARLTPAPHQPRLPVLPLAKPRWAPKAVCGLWKAAPWFPAAFRRSKESPLGWYRQPTSSKQDTEQGPCSARVCNGEERWRDAEGMLADPLRLLGPFSLGSQNLA